MKLTAKSKTALDKFATESGISDARKLQLSRLHFRGTIPQTVDEWTYINGIIEKALQGAYEEESGRAQTG